MRIRPIFTVIGLSGVIFAQVASANLDRFMSRVDDPESPDVSQELRQIADSVASMGHGEGSFFIETAAGFSDQQLDLINFDGTSTGKKISMGDALSYRNLYSFSSWGTSPLYWRLKPSNERLFQYLQKYGIAKSILWRADPWEQKTYPDGRDLPGNGHCTGFLIGPNVLMTNNHCVSTQEKCDIVAFRFNEELDSSLNSLKSSDVYQCRRVIVTDRVLDFSLVEVAGDPSLKHSPIRMSVRRPVAPETRTKWVWDPLPRKVKYTTIGEDVHVIGHPTSHPAYPQGDAFKTIKKISKPCKVTRGIETSGWGLEPTPIGFEVALNYDEWFGKGAFGKQLLVPETHFETNCAIVGGNSGSPVFDKEMNVIGIMNRGNDWVEKPDQEPSAFAIPMSDIFAKYAAVFKSAGVIVVE